MFFLVTLVWALPNPRFACFTHRESAEADDAVQKAMDLLEQAKAQGQLLVNFERNAAQAELKASEVRQAMQSIASKRRILQRSLEEQSSVVEQSRQRALARMGKFKTSDGKSKPPPAFAAPSQPTLSPSAPSLSSKTNADRASEKIDTKVQADIDFVCNLLKKLAGENGNVVAYKNLDAAYNENGAAGDDRNPLEGVLQMARHLKLVTYDLGTRNGFDDDMNVALI